MAPLHRFPRRHLRQGCRRGHAFAGISTSHDCSSGELIIHLSWDFIPVSDRATLCEASPTFGAYTRLHLAATYTPVSSYNGLHSMGPISGLNKTISRNRAQRLAQLTLLLDFNIGDLIRWLGGAYTHEHTPLAPIRQAINDIIATP